MAFSHHLLQLITALDSTNYCPERNSGSRVLTMTLTFLPYLRETTSHPTHGPMPHHPIHALPRGIRQDTHIIMASDRGLAEGSSLNMSQSLFLWKTFTNWAA